MRLIWFLGVAGLGLGACGCRMAAEITHNMVFETCLFVDEVKGKVCYPVQAITAWKEYAGCHPEKAESNDFAHGFRQGYADYLENGGDGNSRSLPPLRYWKIRHETPEGRAAMQMWMTGFREGAAAARHSGTRELIVVPVGEPVGPPPPPVAPSAPPPAATPAPTTDPAKAPQSPEPPMDYLPEPRTLKPLSYSPTSWRIDPATVMPATPGSAAPVKKKGAHEARSTSPQTQGPVLSDSQEPPSADGPTQVHLKYVPQDIDRFKATAATRMQKTPRDPEPLYQVGMVALRAGAEEEGLRWLHKALAEDPKHAPTHKALMEYYQRIGDFHRAAEHRVLAEMQLSDTTKTDEKVAK